MYQEEMATMRLDVIIPAQRLLTQANLLVDQYKPIVEEALKESMFDLTNNEELKTALKERIKQKLKNKINEELDRRADNAIREVMESKKYDFYGVVDKALKELIDKNRIYE